MVTKYDAVIVGGGIAGSYTAKLIAEQDNSVLVLEEHHEVGKPLQCAGLVTPSAPSVYLISCLRMVAP